MRAWTYTTRGPVNTVLHLTPTHPTPTPDPASADLLVKITHTSLTPSVARLMPLLPFHPIHPTPSIPELSFAGTIAAVTPQTPSHLTPGLRVFGSIPVSAQLARGAGTLAQYVVARPQDVAAAPDNLSSADAAGLDGNGQTALQMCRNAGVGEGVRVFVNGGTGGVGTMVVQVAKAFGAEVVATGSGEEGRKLVEGLGADVVVDYRACGEGGVVGWLAERYGEGRKFDAVLDCVGTQVLFDRSPAFLKEDGLFAYERILSQRAKGKVVIKVQDP
ncbi:NAD(P)-binding protein [Neofusicoccum parvum]|nr:NAD(P)-binding protein [Neofusicoccum parvum]